jgi:hypothetical protein
LSCSPAAAALAFPERPDLDDRALRLAAALTRPRAYCQGMGKGARSTDHYPQQPGASTIIGMRELAQAKPDGYTIGTPSSSSYLAALTVNRWATTS